MIEKFFKGVALLIAAVIVLLLAVLSWFYITSNHQNVEPFVLTPRAPAAAVAQASAPEPQTPAQESPNQEAPDQQTPDQQALDQQAAPADDGILIFGATRNTGLDVAKILTARGDQVTAVVREGSDATELEKLGVNIVRGDALDLASVQASMAGKKYRAVLTTIACFSCEVRPDYLGNKNIFDVALETGHRRVVLVTTIGAGDSYESAPLPARMFLKEMLPLKTQAEDHLKSLGLDYTIIRPGGLKTASPTGRAILSEDRKTSGIITRADLAQLIVGVLDDDNAIGKTLAAIDRDFRFPFDMR